MLALIAKCHVCDAAHRAESVQRRGSLHAAREASGERLGTGQGMLQRTAQPRRVSRRPSGRRIAVRATRPRRHHPSPRRPSRARARRRRKRSGGRSSDGTAQADREVRALRAAVARRLRLAHCGPVAFESNQAHPRGTIEIRSPSMHCNLTCTCRSDGSRREPRQEVGRYQLHHGSDIVWRSASVFASSTASSPSRGPRSATNRLPFQETASALIKWA